MRTNATNSPKKRDYYTIPEAALLLDVSVATVWRWVAAGRLDAYRVGPRTIRIKKQELESVISPARDRQAPVKPKRVSFPPPAASELARRQALVESILQGNQERSIAPMTSAELVRKARKEEMRSYGRRP